MLRHLLGLVFPNRRKPYNLAEQTGSVWVERADAAASAIRRVVDADGPVTVADVGCGDRKLRATLTRELGARLVYTGFDILPQSPEVEQLDLSQRTVPGTHDVVALLGVSEYIDDVPALLARVAQSARFVCFTYTIADSGQYEAAKVAERGWKHHHSKSQIDEFARDIGFVDKSYVALNDGKTGLWLWDVKSAAEGGIRQA